VPQEDVTADAGRVKRVYAACAAALFLAGFLYVFWRVGRSWPGVPPAADGIFHLKQAHLLPASVYIHLASSPYKQPV
jgi:hypothetical protein